MWSALGAPYNIALGNLYDTLIAHYNESHRHYHTQQHLEECLENFAELRHLAENPEEIELALWFHDAIYQPSRHDNEQLSADWAKACVISAGINETTAERIYDLIMATRHNQKPEDFDTNILVDVDLAILGARPERYHEYEGQIRLEYNVVPEEIFRNKRAEILNHFLSQTTIFNTSLFIERYEAQARTNIKQSLEKLCPN